MNYNSRVGKIYDRVDSLVAALHDAEFATLDSKGLIDHSLGCYGSVGRRGHRGDIGVSDKALGQEGCYGAIGINDSGLAGITGSVGDNHSGITTSYISSQKSAEDSIEEDIYELLQDAEILVRNITKTVQMR